MVLKKFHFLLGESCHGDRLDSVGRVEASPETHREEGVRVGFSAVKKMCTHVQDRRGGGGGGDGEEEGGNT